MAQRNRGSKMLTFSPDPQNELAYLKHLCSLQPGLRTLTPLALTRGHRPRGGRQPRDGRSRPAQPPGREADTVRRVKETIARNAFQPHVAAAELARGRARRFAFVMRRGQIRSCSRSVLSREMSAWLSAPARCRAGPQPTCSIRRARASLEALQEIMTASRVALDHPGVRAAIDDLSMPHQGGDAGLDVPSSRPHSMSHRQHRAARTLARCRRRPAKVRQGRDRRRLAGLADHAERIFGFNQSWPRISRLSVLRCSKGGQMTARNSFWPAVRQASDIVGL